VVSRLRASQQRGDGKFRFSLDTRTDEELFNLTRNAVVSGHSYYIILLPRGFVFASPNGRFDRFCQRGCCASLLFRLLRRLLPLLEARAIHKYCTNQECSHVPRIFIRIAGRGRGRYYQRQTTSLKYTMASARGGPSGPSTLGKVYQIDFTAVASGKRIASSKRRVRW